MSKLMATVRTASGAREAEAWQGRDGFVITRSVESNTYGHGYVITHALSGMRLPGHVWLTIKAAREALAQLVARVPDAGVIAGGLACKRASTADVDRMRDAWRSILGIPDFARYEPAGDTLRSILPDGWDGDEDTLTCPCGHVIEHDGRCPSGHVSPLRAMGLV